MSWLHLLRGSDLLGASQVTHGKESACQCRSHRRHGFDPWVGKNPWKRKWQPIPVFLPGKSHRQRSLAGCSPRGHRVGHDWSSWVWACSWSVKLGEIWRSCLHLNLPHWGNSLFLFFPPQDSMHSVRSARIPHQVGTHLLLKFHDIHPRSSSKIIQHNSRFGPGVWSPNS